MKTILLFLLWSPLIARTQEGLLLEYADDLDLVIQSDPAFDCFAPEPSEKLKLTITEMHSFDCVNLNTLV